MSRLPQPYYYFIPYINRTGTAFAWIGPALRQAQGLEPVETAAAGAMLNKLAPAAPKDLNRGSAFAEATA
jgi:hypothetical protein